METLEPRFDSRQSFYQKAHYTISNGIKRLYSYGTLVAKINRNGAVYLCLEYSATTNRHIKEFLKQNGFIAETKKQMLTDYEKLKEKINNEQI